MSLYNDIQKPTLLISRRQCLENISRMYSRAEKSGVVFRPHFKTHHSLEIGRWFKDVGVDSITVSSVEMAEFFAADNWGDITIAFPFNIREMDAVNKLALSVKLNLLVEDYSTLVYLADYLNQPVGFFIKIDSGYHRTGILPGELKKISTLLQFASDTEILNFMGFLTHSGHTYNCHSKDQISKIFSDTSEMMNHLKSQFIDICPELILSIGDTPSCSLVENFIGIDEIRPGNFIFYDIMQHQLGSCSLDQIAAAVACPVVARHQSRGELVIYGGAVHLSTESILSKNGTKIYGYPVILADNGWCNPSQGNYVSSLSQEHGVVKISGAQFDHIQPGDLIGILPVHSCLTNDLLRKRTIYLG